MTNPLLDTSSLPRFDDIKPEHVLPAIRQVIADNRSQLESLLGSGSTPDIDALVAPVEHMDQAVALVGDGDAAVRQPGEVGGIAQQAGLPAAARAGADPSAAGLENEDPAAVAELRAALEA